MRPSVRHPVYRKPEKQDFQGGEALALNDAVNGIDLRAVSAIFRESSKAPGQRLCMRAMSRESREESCCPPMLFLRLVPTVQIMCPALQFPLMNNYES
jgi:hypothetical protein